MLFGSRAPPSALSRSAVARVVKLRSVLIADYTLRMNLIPRNRAHRAVGALNPSPRRTAIAIGCALALVLASCASEESTATAPAPAPAEPTAPPPAEPATPPSPTEAPAAATGSDSDQPPAQIIATTTIWADITRNVTCGGLAEVESIIPPVADPHDFEPSLADRARLDAADLIVENGLGLEQALADTLAAAVADGTPIFSAAEQVTTIAFDADMFGGHGHGDEHDPHPLHRYLLTSARRRPGVSSPGNDKGPSDGRDTGHPGRCPAERRGALWAP